MAEERIYDDDLSKNGALPEGLVDTALNGIDEDEAAVMTPEQLAVKIEEQRKYEEERREYVNGLISSAEADCKAGKYATCLEALEEAGEVDDENGEVYALKMAAYTRNFTDYTDVLKAAENAAGVKKYSSAERKAQIRARAGAAVDENIAQLTKEVRTLERENEAKKQERAVTLVADRKKALIIFLCTLVPLITFTVLSAYFGSVIFTVSTGLYLVLTCVFGGLAFLSLLVAAFAARWLNITCRRVRLNSRDSSTKLGRKLIKAQSRLNAFNAIKIAIAE